MFSIFGGIKTYLIIGVAIAVLCGIFYLYYKDSQAKIQLLMKENAALTVKTQVQDKTIAALQADIKKQAQVLSETFKKFDQARRENQSLSDRLSKHDLGHLAEKKPGLVEPIINKATKDAQRCIEIISGSPLTEKERKATKKSEINNECPSLANPNYIPN